MHLETRRIELLATTPPLRWLNFQLTPDGRRMLLCEDGQVVRLDVDTRQRIVLAPLARIEDHRLGGYHAAIDPSGHLGALYREMGVIEIYDLESGELLRKITGDFPGINTLRFHPSGKWVGMTELYGSWRFRQWDVMTCEEITQPDWTAIAPDIILDFDYSHDGKLVAFGHRCQVSLYHVDSGERFHNFTVDLCVKNFHLAFTRDDSLLLTRTDYGVLNGYHLRDE